MISFQFLDRVQSAQVRVQIGLLRRKVRAKAERSVRQQTLHERRHLPNKREDQADRVRVHARQADHRPAFFTRHLSVSLNPFFYFYE